MHGSQKVLKGTELPEPLTGAEIVALVTDAGSFGAWDEDVVSTDPLGFVDSAPYTERLRRAVEKTGRSEAVLTGRATIEGRPVAIVAGEFRFMAGSVGVAAGERVTRTFERALQESLPMIALPCSGGARMQEGALGFVQMVKTAAAVRRFRAGGLPYASYLLDPTTGGVLASWASLAHVTWAEPGALIGFAGPRVALLQTGRSLPEGVQTAENLQAHGVIDDVFERSEIRERAARWLAVTAGEQDGVRVVPEPELEPVPPGDAWASIEHSRAPDRPGALDLLEACATDFTLLGGDGQGGGDDPACLALLAHLGGVPVVVVAQERTADERRAHMTAAGYRKARRAFALADELGLPLLTIIDSPAADLSRTGEEQGLAAELARCLYDLAGLGPPTLAMLLGEGGGGGALALLACDRVIAAEHAWLAPLAPEGASAIVYRTTDRAAELAEAQGLASWELARHGIVDDVVK
ncbi:carboxyl transferase domain-containing protein [soil metagenome]